MNTTDRLASQRYAAAYDRLSADTAQAQALADDLRVATRALSSVKRYMTDPRVMLVAKKQLVFAALKQAPKTASFIVLLLEAKRYTLLENISARVDTLLDARKGIVRAEVVSAHPLTPQQRTKTIETLSARYRQTVEVVFRTDESLLGGLTVSCNGEYIDGSVSGRLKKLQAELTK